MSRSNQAMPFVMRTISSSTRRFLTPADVQLKSGIGGRMSGTAAQESRRRMIENEDERNTLAYCVSFAPEESYFSRNYVELFSNDMMMEQLRISRDQLKRVEVKYDSDPLPKTLQDALRPSRRAIVITEATKPFRVVDVNSAWESLCGHSYVEAKGRTLGDLLQGPETNKQAATALIAQLLLGEEAGTCLTNYRKDGRPFRNRIRVGPLLDESKVTHFIGVLQEV